MSKIRRILGVILWSFMFAMNLSLFLDPPMGYPNWLAVITIMALFSCLFNIFLHLEALIKGEE